MYNGVHPSLAALSTGALCLQEQLDHSVTELSRDYNGVRPVVSSLINLSLVLQ